MFCLFGVFVPLQNFNHYRWKATNFDLHLALTAIKQWGFFSVPHLLWLGLSVYKLMVISNDTHINCREFGSGAVTLTCFYDLCLSRLGFEHPTFRLRGEHSKPTAPPPRFVRIEMALYSEKNLSLLWCFAPNLVEIGLVVLRIRFGIFTIS